MTWYFLDTDFNTGKYNMEFDLHLASICKQDEAYFRLYRWAPYCISLGAGQEFNSVNMNKAREDKLDVVKRPTGGRAVLHSEEITYSVTISTSSGFSAKEIYFRINAALTEGLKLYHPTLSEVEMEQNQLDIRNFYNTTAGNVCFAAPSKNELKFTGRKIVGSAQRKMNNVILQHGSVLCGSYHKKIAGYLYLNEGELNKINLELGRKTTDISSVLGVPVDYNRLKECLVEGFEFYFKIKLNRLDSVKSLN